MRQLLKDENGKWSSSRVVMFLFVAAFFVGLFGPFDFNETAGSTIQQVILLCLGTVGVRSAIKNSK